MRTVEMVINSLPNQNTGVSPLFLNYGHDVVHCVQVSLTGTTMAQFWACWSVVGDWFEHNNLTLDIIRGNRGPSNVVV